MEETVSFKWGEDRLFDKEYFVQFIVLFHVPIHHPKKGSTLFHKPHLVNWVVVCRKNKKGDWTSETYQSLIRLSWENGRGDLRMKLTLPPWKWVIVGKYRYEERGWCTKEVKEGYGVGIWKTIRRGWEVLKDRIGFKVSSSNKVNFWLDKWCGDTTLRDSFLILYSTASSKVV